MFLGRNKYFEYLSVPFVFLIIASLYFFRLPMTVQAGGDTAELVYAAHGLLVPHPPGYPLWVWLGNLFLKIPIEGPVYWRLALLNGLLALGCLWFVFKISTNKLIGLVAVLFLAVSSAYWKYAEIPEVFSLHALLVAALLFCASSERSFSSNEISKRVYFLPYLFFLGSLNHLTIIFTLPVVFWCAWRVRYKIWWYINSLVAFILFLLGYYSLLFLDVHNLYSWGSVVDIQTLLRHFLRSEYGTFSLSANAFDFREILQVYFYFFRYLILSLGAFVALCGLSVYLNRKSGRRVKASIDGYQISIFIGLILYVALFIGRANIHVSGVGEDILSRFFIMPSMFVIVLCLSFFREKTFSDIGRKGLAIAVGGLYFVITVFAQGDRYDYSRNTILEDYAINLLVVAKERKVSFIFLHTDTELFSVRYAQQVLGLSQEVIVATVFNFAEPWFYKKVQKRYPEFQFSGEYGFNVEKDLFEPNVKQFPFITTKSFKVQSDLKITFLPLGRLVEKGTGKSVASESFIPKFRSSIDVIKTPMDQYDVYRDIFAQYSYYFLSKGLVEYRETRLSSALDSFEKALALVPYCTPALGNICKIKNRLSLTDERCATLSESSSVYPYFNQSL